jgi:hypothetical protein
MGYNILCKPFPRSGTISPLNKHVPSHCGLVHLHVSPMFDVRITELDSASISLVIHNVLQEEKNISLLIALYIHVICNDSGFILLVETIMETIMELNIIIH